MLIRMSGMCVLFGVLSTASADLENPLVPDWAGDPTATHYEWNSFTQAYNAPNFPDSPFSSDVQLFNFTEGALIAGSGNIYNPNGGLNIHMYGAGAFELAVLNIATSGSELNYDQTFLSVRSATGDEAIFTSMMIERYREEVPGLGYNMTVAYQFDTSDVTFEIADWGFLFNGTEQHLSLDAVSLDINTVPAPASLLGIGLLSAVRRRRR
jgi:hypothetical protein